MGNRRLGLHILFNLTGIEDESDASFCIARSGVWVACQTADGGKCRAAGATVVTTYTDTGEACTTLANAQPDAGAFRLIAGAIVDVTAAPVRVVMPSTLT